MKIKMIGLVALAGLLLSVPSVFAQSANIYNLANHPSVELQNPLDIQAKRIAIQNARQAGELLNQQIESNRIALDQQRREAEIQNTPTLLQDTPPSPPVTSAAASPVQHRETIPTVGELIRLGMSPDYALNMVERLQQIETNRLKIELMQQQVEAGRALAGK